ncbi:MAG: hypothetical protein ABSF13_10285 [Smithella sp.]|jgi:hypothetical protein
MKGYNGPSIVCAVLLFGAVLVSPAFADKKKVDDADLAQINASVTGTSVKVQSVAIQKDEDNPEILQARERENLNTKIGSSPSVTRTTEPISQEQNINGQTYQFSFGRSTLTTTGGITSVK